MKIDAAIHLTVLGRLVCPRCGWQCSGIPPRSFLGIANGFRRVYCQACYHPDRVMPLTLAHRLLWTPPVERRAQ
jgi:hypothetical protein